MAALTSPFQSVTVGPCVLRRGALGGHGRGASISHLSARGPVTTTREKTAGVPCQALGSAWTDPRYQENAYFSDDDVSNVESLLSMEVSSWLDANYVSLSVTCHRLIKQQNVLALHNHFSRQAKDAASSVMGALAGDDAVVATPNGEGHRHECCAPRQDHTFLCGENLAVAEAVAPASVKVEGHFIGTP